MEKLKVEVTVEPPDEGGQRASRWVVVAADGRQVRNAPEALIRNDPRGVLASHQARVWVQHRAQLAGEQIELNDIPVEVWSRSAGGERSKVVP